MNCSAPYSRHKVPAGNRRPLQALALATALAGVLALQPALAQRGGASDISAVPSMLVAVSVVGGALLVADGSGFVVKAVEKTAQGVSWVVERAADGASATIQLSGQAAAGLSVAAGTAVTASAIGTGWVLSAAGRAVAFVPNEVGRALLHHERVSDRMSK